MSDWYNRTESLQLKWELTRLRNAGNVKKIITKHVSPGNFIITDNWRGNDWSDNNVYGYAHIKHNHS